MVCMAGRRACMAVDMHGRGGMHSRGPCMAGEACMAGGYAWQGVCVAGGMHHRGACMAGGHAWQGGMHSRGPCMAGEACMAGGYAWQGVCVAGGMHHRGACMAGGMHGRGHVWQGACMAGGHECTHNPRQILRAGGTHPTGKHSWKIFFLLIVKEWTAFHNWLSCNPSRSASFCGCP